VVVPRRTHIEGECSKFRFHYERLVRGVSQLNLANQTGIIKSTLALMEKGRVVPH